MKIAIINRHHSSTLGGSELQADLIGSELVRYGHDVVYLAVGGRAKSYESPYRVVNVDLWPPELLELLEREKPDLVYWRHNKNLLLPTVVAAQWLGVPLVFSCAHDTDVQSLSSTIATDSPISFRRTKTLLQKTTNAVNYGGFQLVSGAVAQTGYQFQRLPVKNKVLIRNFYDPRAEPFSWPRRFIAWVGTVKQRKRPEIFVRLATSCRDLNTDFLMVGGMSDPAYAWIAEESSEYLPNFYYLGERTPAQANGIIGAAQFVVHTSDAEGFSNVLIQAWMNHKPTLTVSVDPDQLIEGYQMGRRCPDFGDLVQTTRELSADPDRIALYGANARRKAEQLFDREQNMNQLLSFFWQTLEGRQSQQVLPHR